MSQNRKMKVDLLDEKTGKKIKIRGNNCGIKRKSMKTRIGREFDETIRCENVKIKK